MTDFIDNLLSTFPTDEEKLDELDSLISDLQYKKMEIITKKGNREKLRPRFQKKMKERMEQRKRVINFKKELRKKPDPKIWQDDAIQKSGTELIKNLNFNKWVFSAGGCGTNYVRKLIEVFRIKNRQIINPVSKNIITSIHMFQPPEITTKDFLAIYVFGDPYLALASICRRVIAPTLNILAGKDIAHDLLPKTIEERKIMRMNRNKDQNDGIKIINFLNKYPTDILRLKDHWDNWYNAKVNYPILFIKYETLQESFDEIKELYGEKYNLSWRKLLKKEFIPRVCSLDKFSKEEIEKLDNIYGDFREKINSMPSFWLKEPEL